MNTNWNDPNFQGFGGRQSPFGKRPPRPNKARKAIGTPLSRTLINLAVTLIFAAVYFYVVLPPINLQAEEFYFFMLLCCAVYCGCAVLTSGFQGSGAKGYFGFVKKQCRIPVIIAVALVAVAIVGGIVGWQVIRAGAYRDLLTVETGDFAAEVEEITTICGGLNINIGTLNSRTVTSMLLAGKKANQLGHPVVLDPVGAGASHLRTDTAFRLLREVQFTVIRGNISEIKTLASGAGTTKGVDADVADKVTEENLDSAVAFAKAFAARTGAVVAITGAIDIVADAQKAYCIRNGNAMMSSITGTGCQLSALTAAFVTANPGHPLEAAAAAVCAMGLAGEIAHQRLTPQDGNATYRNYIIDAIYNMTPEQLEKGANYEVR